jgi:hypothetical protein
MRKKWMNENAQCSAGETMARDKIQIYFPYQSCCIMKNIYLIYIIYKGLDIVYGYHYYQMMLQANNFLYKSETLRNYWLLKQASEE